MWILQIVALALLTLASVLVFRELLAAVGPTRGRRSARGPRAPEPHSREATPFRRAA